MCEYDKLGGCPFNGRPLSVMQYPTRESTPSDSVESLVDSALVNGDVTYAAFQSPRANGAHDFEVGKIPVQPYVAFHSLTEPRWLIVLSCSFLLCLLLALFNSVNRVFVLQRTHALHTCSCTSLTQQRINLKPTHRAYQHST